MKKVSVVWVRLASSELTLDILLFFHFKVDPFLSKEGKNNPDRELHPTENVSILLNPWHLPSIMSCLLSLYNLLVWSTSGLSTILHRCWNKASADTWKVYTKYRHRHKQQRYRAFFQAFHHLTLVLLNPDIPCLCKQCRSRSVGFWRSQLIWICSVCH